MDRVPEGTRYCSSELGCQSLHMSVRDRLWWAGQASLSPLQMPATGLQPGVRQQAHEKVLAGAPPAPERDTVTVVPLLAPTPMLHVKLSRTLAHVCPQASGEAAASRPPATSRVSSSTRPRSGQPRPAAAGSWLYVRMGGSPGSVQSVWRRDADNRERAVAWRQPLSPSGPMRPHAAFLPLFVCPPLLAGSVENETVGLQCPPALVSGLARANIM